ncbi:MAG: hypothetical protein LBT60_00710 [Oscillospiraceae bacterium]|jgi:hypothetical protein|nr:hypothetical protein [Oscillospiraceae bacterium]
MKRKQTACLILSLVLLAGLLAGCNGDTDVSPDPEGSPEPGVVSPIPSPNASTAPNVPTSPVLVSTPPEQDLTVATFVYPETAGGIASAPAEDSPIDVIYLVSDFSAVFTSTNVNQQALAGEFATGWTEKMRTTTAAIAPLPPLTATEEVIDIPGYGGKGLQVDLDCTDLDLFWRMLLLFNNGKLVAVHAYGMESERETVMAVYDDLIKNVKLA